MEDKELLELLMEIDLVKYSWESNFDTDYTYWTCDLLQDTEDRLEKFRYLKGNGHTNYDLKKGVYCYKQIGNSYELKAIIVEDKIKYIGE